MSARCTLALDASTYTGTATVFRDDVAIAITAAEMRGKDEERLMPAVASALESAGIGVGVLARVVCGGGPGSFTSLRIASSIAKGIAMGRGIPLVAVPSLALAVAADARAAGRYLATMDAMRGDRYASLVEVGTDGRVLAVEPHVVVRADAIDGLARELAATVVRVEDDPPHARNALRVLGARGAADDPVDLDAWEPTYGRLAEAQVKWEAAHGRPLRRE